MRRRLAALCVVSLIAMMLPGSALAHQSREVGGKYRFEAGFLSEPPLAGEMNGLDLRVTVPAENDRPVQGLERTLKAVVIVGGDAKTMDLVLEPRENQPGAYEAKFIPTQAGSYIFRISGSVEGIQVDERFESGPGRFDDVQPAETLQFPVKVPDTAAMSAELRAAREDANTARLLGLAGVVFGLAGLAAGGTAFVLSRRGSRMKPATPQDTPGPESRAA